MKTLISCAYNMDNCCVEVKFSDGSMIAIDTIVVENEIADNMYQRSELDYLIYNAPLEYADLILNGDPETYLKTVTEYKPWDSRTTRCPQEKILRAFFCLYYFPPLDLNLGKKMTILKLFPHWEAASR